MTKALPHKLAAVLYADVAGYSRLTADDEVGTHRQLSEGLDAFATTVKRHGGRVMHYAGDAILARFDAVINALACAIDVQRELAMRNSGLMADRKVEFRIGVNLGDVIEDRGDIYGDGVNIAARLESIAAPGEICVSESVRAAAGKKLDLQFEDLGEQALKNIDRPVRAYRVIAVSGPDPVPQPPAASRWSLPVRAPYLAVAAVLLAAAAFIVVSYVPADHDAIAFVSPTAPSAEPDGVLPRSVAVLPFDNLSPDPSDAYFAVALHAEVINQLVKVGSLNVIRAASVVQYAGSGRPLEEIARELNVGTVLEATVAYTDERIALNATLTDAASRRLLWAERYDHNLEDAFGIQVEIAKALANELANELVPAQPASLERPTNSPEAYAFYLQAITLTGRENASERAIDLLSRAIELDDDFADAHARRAATYAAGIIDNTIGDSVSAAARPDHERLARADAERALELDETSAEALSALTGIDVVSWRWTSARSRLSHLMGDADPGTSPLPLYRFYLGERDAAIRSARRGVELSPNEWLAYRNLGWVLRMAGDTQGARNALLRGTELAPDRAILHRWLAYVALTRGDNAQALEEVRITERLLGEERPRIALAELAKVYGQLGRSEDAQRLFDEIMSAGDPQELGAGTLAAAYLGIGDSAGALESLHTAVRKVRNNEPDPGFWSLMHLVHDVTAHPVLTQPEFVEVLSQIHGS